ncbi:SdiA-regulated domain-containing protein [Pontibacter roseus]|uniref:SdiA-regulated domain-containing protein n=1 Tax=Pontibacter roseus TaxID=336989 RepID=UPI00037907CC|nr:SdiA-regulated domain-containing protein [Pontibacter roseus]
MKKNTIMAFALAALLAGSSCNSIWPETEVPEAVKDTFVELYPSTQNVEWDQEAELYEAEFLISGRERKALFRPDGTLVSYTEEIEERHLPGPVQQLLQQSYNQYKVDEAHRVQKGETAHFEVELEDKTKELWLLMNESGEVLEQKPASKPAASKREAASLLPLSPTDPASGTDLNAPTSQWTLPAELQEVSAIALLEDGLMACVQDEEGKIFLYDLEKKSIVDQISFGGPGDYEGIAIVGQDAYVLRSDGSLFEVPDFRGGQPKAVTHQASFPTSIDMEGLAYDASNNRLLLAPKGHDEKLGDAKGIYAFSLSDKKMQSEPVMTISMSQGQLSATGKKKKKSKFDALQPSSLEVHPQNGTYYMLDAANSRLLTLDDKGAIQKAQPLDKKLLRQPEGLAFGPNGEMYISSEGGKKGNGLIVKYPSGI